MKSAKRISNPENHNSEETNGIAYHGTPYVEKVLQEGLLTKYALGGCQHIWLARKFEDAVAFGDVVEVDTSFITGGLSLGHGRVATMAATSRQKDCERRGRGSE